MKAQCIDREANQELGMFLPIAGVVLLALIAVVGLAIDAANLYRAQMRLQRAVDAGAIAATALMGTSLSPTQLEAVARSVALSNTNLMGLPLAQISVPNSSPPNININGIAPVPVIFLRMLPGFSSANQVAASAQAETVRSVVSLVVDVTGSMNCPAVGTCNCNPCSGPTKLDKLKESAKAFANIFDENLDYLSLVTFSANCDAQGNHACVIHPMGHFSKTGLANQIDNLTAQGWTDIQAGMLEGQVQISNAPATVKPFAKKSLVLITDGAPNRSDDNSPPACASVPNNDNRRHYDKTILAADDARSAGTNVYTIGLGNLDPGTNAYQTNDLPDDGDNDLKSFLLRRSANCEEAAQNPTGADDFVCPQSYAAYNTLPQCQLGQPCPTPKPKGKCLSTPDANQLQSMLVTLGKSIKIRMTQ